VDGPVRADAFRRAHLDRALEHGRTGEADGGVIVRLDPGLAFGSGTHPTTALCLQWLDCLAEARMAPLRGADVLDFGCGSGILALAALKLGAAHAAGVDNDPQALAATRDNADRNGVGAQLRFCLPEDAPNAPIRWSSPTSSRSRSMRLAEHLAARTAPAARSPCPASSPARKTHCCCATRLVRSTAVARQDDWCASPAAPRGCAAHG
jgi:ribosomal protein L11 methyltransferase